MHWEDLGHYPMSSATVLHARNFTLWALPALDTKEEIDKSIDIRAEGEMVYLFRLDHVLKI